MNAGVNLEAYIKPQLVRAIEAWYLEQRSKEPPRLHLGGSEIGRECDRALWYRWRFAARAEFDGATVRFYQNELAQETADDQLWVAR
jgi:hypothetical protein